jgi:MFS family permease
MARATGVRMLAGVPSRSTRDSGSTPEGEEHAGSQSVLTDLLVGLRYAWRDPIIRTILLVLVGINAAMMGPLYVGGATLAQRELGGVGAFGVLVAAASAGALLGSLIAGSITRVRRRGIAVLVLTASLGLEVAAFCLVTNLAVAIMLALAIGASASFLAVINISWLQERAEPGLTGRVMSLAVLATMALDPISFALAGVLVEVNLKATFVGAGALLLLTAMLGATNRAMRVAD